MTWNSLQAFRTNTNKNVLRLQEEKKAGRKVVGQYCTYSPTEFPQQKAFFRAHSVPSSKAALALLSRTAVPILQPQTLLWPIPHATAKRRCLSFLAK